ncbi:MAG TPA: Cys-tRNA(Pro) deacylase [Papillibacter sp.]|nr:Cys-tRNA(Pro) deacylase [Papillibacter sp.]
MVKTNAMRILEREKIKYTPHTYDDTVLDGQAVAKLVGQPAQRVFKTLVTTAGEGKYAVFALSVEQELDLKKAARAAGVKALSMLPQKMLQSVTGYVRGGCSPVGMKKKLTTVIDEDAFLQETIFVSAGRCGVQIEVAPRDLARCVGAVFDDVKAEG